MLVCSFCEARPGSLSVANIAPSPENVAVEGSVDVGRSAMYSRHIRGLRTLPWGTPALTWGELCVLSFNIQEKMSAMQIGFE
jgi:hypothetical protein